MKSGKRKQRRLLSQFGYSLLEVMVSVALLGIVAMGAVSIGEQTSSQARVNRIGNNIFQVYEMVRSRTFMEQDCTAFLRAPGGGANILNFNPTLAAQDGMSVGNEGQPFSISLNGVNGLGDIDVTEGTELTDLGLEVETLRLTNARHIDDGDGGISPKTIWSILKWDLPVKVPTDW